eukprot:jgi/Ulvmu1/2236/UM013_0083.1
MTWQVPISGGAKAFELTTAGIAASSTRCTCTGLQTFRSTSIWKFYEGNPDLNVALMHSEARLWCFPQVMTTDVKINSVNITHSTQHTCFTCYVPAAGALI